MPSRLSRFCLLCGLLFSFTPYLSAQSALTELEEVIGAYRAGEGFRENVRRLPVLEAAFAADKDWVNQARARHYLGELYYELEEKDRAYAAFRKAEELLRKRGIDSTQLDFYHLILQGQAAYHTRRTEAGKTLYRRLIDFVEEHRPNDRLALADALLARSTLAYEAGDYGRAGEQLRIALDVGQGIHTEWERGLSYNNLAAIYAGEYALEKAQAAQQLATAFASSPTYRLESLLNEVNLQIDLRELSAAQRNLTQAHAILLEELRPGNVGWLQYFGSLGYFYNTDNDLPRFADLLEEWDDFLRQYPRHREPSSLARYWNYRASYAIRTRDYDTALTALREVGQLDDRFGIDYDLTLSRYLLRAKVAGATGDFELAARLFHALIIRWVKEGTEVGEGPDAHLPAAALGIDLEPLRLIKDRAAMYSARDLEEGGDTYRRYAQREIGVGDSLIRALRQWSDAPGFRRLVDEVALDLRKIEVGLAERNYRERPDRAFLEAALHASEQIKYLDLSEELINDRLAQDDPVIRALLARERENRRAVDERVALLRERSLDSSTLSGIRRELERLGTERDSLRSQLLTTRETALAGREQERITVALLRERIIGPREALLHLVDQDTIVYLIYVDHEREHFLRVKSRERIGDRVQRLLGRIDSIHPGIYTDLRDFHELLIEPVAGLIGERNLIIVPDGVLNYLPFAALIEPGNAADGYGHPYLLRRRGIRLLLNCRSALLQPTVTRQPPELPVLALAPFSASGTDNWRALSNSKRTIDFLSDRLGSKQCRSFTAAAATRDCFLREAGQANVLHIGTHTKLDDERPSRSALLFAPIDDPEQSGYLRAGEIGTMDLGADLAVLAACRTMDGRLYRGRGVANLTEAFTRAGCFNLLVNLWEIRDATASQLLTDFYAELYENRLPKHEALRQAQLKYLDESMDLTEHPAYWATLVYVGNARPLAEMPGRNWWPFALGGLIVVGLLLRYSSSRSGAASSRA